MGTRRPGSGRFITFEGVEGSGKSSRCEALHGALSARGLEAIHTREPGGPPVSERIREILLDRSLAVTALTEVMLYLASRAANVDQVVRPALESGMHVLCERYSDATMAYQVGGRGLEREAVARADRLATGGLVPHLTILLDLDPEVGMGRLGSQGRQRDRIELERMEFHRRVREAYLEMARDDGRFFVVDATLEPAEQDRIILQRCIAVAGLEDGGDEAEE